LLEGVRAGESIPQLADRVTRAYNKPITVNVPPKLDAAGNVVRAGYSYALDNEAWATTVARSETARAFAEGKLEGYRQTGVVSQVEFVVTPDERLCPACNLLSGTRYKLNDAGGVIPVHANCRCTFMLVADIDESAMKKAQTNVDALVAGE
jgi:SPP1 gp7 family putative phage head morphogenesis protein